MQLYYVCDMGTILCVVLCILVQEKYEKYQKFLVFMDKINDGVVNILP